MRILSRRCRVDQRPAPLFRGPGEGSFHHRNKGLLRTLDIPEEFRMAEPRIHGVDNDVARFVRLLLRLTG